MATKQRFSEDQAHPYGPAVGQLIEQFATLPGIGRKSAERLAHHVLASPREEAMRLAEAIRQVKDAVHPCSQCFNLTEGELCAICRDSKRQRHTLCIVEQPRDVVALEAAGVFQGLYHVLQGRISPLEGVGPEDLTIGPLVQRVRNTGVTEIVMATNPTVEGDGTALYISNLLAGEPLKITRLARGIPTGSVLEFANREMLADALTGRQEF
jgi:recombination protein RecR